MHPPSPFKSATNSNQSGISLKNNNKNHVCVASKNKAFSESNCIFTPPNSYCVLQKLPNFRKVAGLALAELEWTVPDSIQFELIQSAILLRQGNTNKHVSKTILSLDFGSGAASSELWSVLVT